MDAFDHATAEYGDMGVDVERALGLLKDIPVSVHCWQGDDVGGFEELGGSLSGSGLQATGNYPGKARTVQELRDDYELAFSLVPGKHKANLHAIYGEFGGKKVDRDEIELAHYQGWIDWAARLGIGIDFNPTLFSHPKASAGFTLASKDEATRHFWIEHVKRCRDISEKAGKLLGTRCNHNIWIPDGSKDETVDRRGHRELLAESLDEIISTPLQVEHAMDFVEGKLFGIGSESFVAGSHEFYLGYAISRGIGFTMDMGHYHPTESVADKVSATIPFVPELLLHVSRGVRWDSDHVVTFNDEVRALAEEMTRCGKMEKIHVALDFFDASINRIGAWVTGMRATKKALLHALLQPTGALKEAEESGNLFKRLALLEEAKVMPLGHVWDEFCKRDRVPTGTAWIDAVLQHEKRVLSKRK